MDQKHTGLMPFEALRNAIVIQAAKDYRKALAILKKKPNNNAQNQMKVSCEKFFRSAWYKSICNISGEMIMNEIQKEVA